jgi:hypothetical protein
MGRDEMRPQWIYQSQRHVNMRATRHGAGNADGRAAGKGGHRVGLTEEAVVLVLYSSHRAVVGDW